MNTKKLMVSFVAIAMALFVVATVSATLIEVDTSGLITIDEVSVDGIYASNVEDISVTAGETITVKVYFTVDAGEELSDVVFKAELGDAEVEVEKATILADDDSNSSDRVILNIKVPYDFDDDELHKDETLEITIEGEDDNGDEFEVKSEVELEIKRPDHNVDFKSVNVDSKVEAGETMPIDILVKNTGYNDLDDLQVTAKISTLGVEKTFYFGDLVSIDTDKYQSCEWTDDPDGWECEDNDDETDTMNRRMYLTVPYGTEAGTYILEIEVSNEDTIISKTVEIEVTNEFPETVIKSGNDLIIVNPTDNVKGYRIVVESPASVSEEIVFVQAGDSETITVDANTEGEYSFDVTVLSMTGDIVGTVNFNGESAESDAIAMESPVVILTVVLAIIFLVLLVVLIVLVTKKPEKTEEFGESYY